jgi:small subunit ribosomal protein S16
MSVTIRLAKIGKKNAPSYKIVVSNTRDKRTGRYLEILGHYNPIKIPVDFKYNKEAFILWKNKGAMVSDAVKKLIDGKYTYIKYAPKQETKSSRPATAAESKVEAKQEL